MDIKDLYCFYKICTIFKAKFRNNKTKSNEIMIIEDILTQEMNKKLALLLENEKNNTKNL